MLFILLLDIIGQVSTPRHAINNKVHFTVYRGSFEVEIRPKAEAPRYTQWASPARPKTLASGAPPGNNYEDPNQQRRNSPPSANTNGRNGGGIHRNPHLTQPAAARIAGIVQNSFQQANSSNSNIDPPEDKSSSSSSEVPTSLAKSSTSHSPPPSRHYQQGCPPLPSAAIINRNLIPSSLNSVPTTSRLVTAPPISPMQASLVSSHPLPNSSTQSLPRMSMVPSSLSSLPSTGSTMPSSVSSVSTLSMVRNGVDGTTLSNFYRERDNIRPSLPLHNKMPQSTRDLIFSPAAPSTAPPTSSLPTSRYHADTPSSSVSSATTTSPAPGKPGSGSKHTKQSPSVILGEHGGVKTMIWTDSTFYSQAQAQAQAQAAAAAAEQSTIVQSAPNNIKNAMSSQHNPVGPPPHLIKLEPGIAVQAVQAAQAAKAKLEADQRLKMSSAVDGLLSLSSIPSNRRVPTPSNMPNSLPPTSTPLQQLQQQRSHQQHQQQLVAQHSPHPHSPSIQQQSPRLVIPGSQHGPSQAHTNNSPSISPMIRHTNGPISSSSVTPGTPFQTFCQTSPSPNTHPNLPVNVPVNSSNKRRSPMNMERLWAGDQSQLPAHCQENQVICSVVPPIKGTKI